MNYQAFFELTREPFSSDISHSEILVTPALTGVAERIHYAARLGCVALITGEVLKYVRGKKMNIFLVIDEASLFQLGVFAELHTLTQFNSDSKPYLPVVLDY